MNKKEAIFSPLGIFILYILGSAAAIMTFRFILPGEAVPLARFSTSWRLIRGVVDYLNLFPALALSALVIPYGFRVFVRDTSIAFSPQFLQSLKMPMLTAFSAVALYGVLFTLVLPLAREHEANLRFQGRLYNHAWQLARESARKGEFADTANLLAVCERIWPNNEELARFKADLDIRFDQTRSAYTGIRPELSSVSGLPGPQPVSVSDALVLAQTALDEERYFDAHWLASLAERLAGDGSPEQILANRLAGLAWTGVNSIAPTATETRAFTVYRLKREGHEALLAEQWIRAYYIFLELLDIRPDDPDAHRYFALSEEGVRQVAFFIDEMELSLGRIHNGAVYSLPYGSGRMVMRVSSLSTFPDNAYGMDVEVMVFDGDGQALWSMTAPYAKLFPLDFNTSTALLFRALDRMDKTISWENKAFSLEQSAPDTAQLALSIPWDTFILLSAVYRGISGLSPAELSLASKTLGVFGYQKEVFEAELLRRFAVPFFYLPLTIFILALCWRFRALVHPRFIGIPMLGILPIVFSGIEFFCHALIGDLCIWAVISVGFSTAAIIFSAGLLALLAVSLILLVAQHD